MKRTKIICNYSDLKQQVLPQLCGRVFHVTSGENMKSILSDGKILSNQDGRFPFSFPQSENSYGRRHGCVCLFDLRGKSREIIDEALLKFHFLDPHPWSTNTCAYLFLSSNMYSKIIPNTTAKEKKGFIWMEEVEVWYPQAIPLDEISHVIEVQTTNKPDLSCLVSLL